MSSARRTALVVLAAALGIALAAAITWGTSQLVRQRIGLASEPLTAGRQLLPSTTGTTGVTGTSTTTSSRTTTRTVTTTVRETAPAAPPPPLPVQTSTTTTTTTTPSTGEPSDRTGTGAKSGGGDTGRRGDD
jgi:hypothetical protein